MKKLMTILVVFAMCGAVMELKGAGIWGWGGGSSTGGRSRESDDWDDEW